MIMVLLTLLNGKLDLDELTSSYVSCFSIKVLIHGHYNVAICT
jgi:hypothetical protein